MKKLEFKTTIDASREQVWDIMINPTTYREWVNVSWPNSHYEGEWKQGSKIKFIGSEENPGGTQAEFVELRKPEIISAKHVAIINADGTLDSTSKDAQGWVGTLEEYRFTEKKGKTELTVTIHTNPAWESMFTDGWPNALNKLKEIVEREAVTA